MNSRAIALGASVIALTLTGAGSAEAGVLDGVVPSLPQTDVAAKVDAKVQTKVQAKADLPVRVPAKLPHGTSHAQNADTRVETKAQAGAGGAGLDSHAELGTRVGRIGGRVHAGQDVATGVTPKHGARVRLEATGRASGRADLGHGRKARASAKGKTRAAQSIEARTASHGVDHTIRPGGSGSKHKLPLQGIGREVGNPIELSLAGWLIALTAMAVLGGSRLVRRLQRTS
jgi:hypothetical protein